MTLLVNLVSVQFGLAQTAQLQTAPLASFPSPVDSNSPAHWNGSTLYLFNSTYGAVAPATNINRSSGSDQFHLGPVQNSLFLNNDPTSKWMEASWVANDGKLYAWYHYERPVCAGSGLAPTVGALRSVDNGSTFEDLGIVLDASPEVDCSAAGASLAFAGGNGDFSVIPDRTQTYLYFLYTNYAAVAVPEQGVAMARMAVTDRDNPVGKVTKYYKGSWDSPGLGGYVTPSFPANTDTRSSAADFFWGPSVHWNSFLNEYVILMNHACCSLGYPQEGIYVSFNSDVVNPAGWSTPARILAGEKIPYGAPGWSIHQWYPQVLGTGNADTDKLAGQVARFYLGGISQYEIVFGKPACALDATSLFKIARGGFRFNNATQRFVQTITLQNLSPDAIQLPVSLVLDNLSSGTSLYNKSGLTTCSVPSGSPYIDIGTGTIAPNGSWMSTLEFADPAKTSINYTVRVLTGPAAK